MAILNNTGIRMGASGAGGGDAYQIEKSLRFNDDDSAHLTWTPSTTTGNRQKWTWSGWVKRANLGTTQTLFGVIYETYYVFSIRFDSDDKLNIYTLLSGSLVTDAVFRDPSAWYHIILAMDTTQDNDYDRYKLYVNGSQITEFSAEVYPTKDEELSVLGLSTAEPVGEPQEHALGWDTHSTNAYFLDGYMAEVHFIDGQQLTASDFGETNEDTGQWVPIEYAGDTDSYGTNGFYLKFDGTDLGEDSSGKGNDWTPSTTLTASSTDKGDTRCYATDTLYTDVDDVIANGTLIGTDGIGGVNVTDKHIYVVHGNGGVDGAQVFSDGWDAVIYSYSYSSTTDSWTYTGGFGTASSEWDSFDYSYDGTQGSYDLDMNQGTGFTYFSGGDASPDTWSGTFATLDDDNYKKWATISAEFDQSTDTPTTFDDEGNGTGNYATLNPLENEAGTPCTLSQGNLGISVTSGHVRSTIGMSSGEWYCEYTHGTGLGMIGLADGETETAFYLGQATKGNGYGYYSTGTTYGNDTGGAAYGASYTTGDVIGVAFDADAGTLTFYKNNDSQGTAFTGLTSGPYFFAVGVDTMADAVMNFGQRPFAYTPPTDHKALNTYNLDDTEITSGEYEGNGDDDGPVIWMNATPATLKIDTTEPPTTDVDFDPDDVDPLAGGFKIRTLSTNNDSGTTYYWSAETDNAVESAFKYANAQSNE